jgi:hypothetical protein
MKACVIQLLQRAVAWRRRSTAQLQPTGSPRASVGTPGPPATATTATTRKCGTITTTTGISRSVQRPRRLARAPACRPPPGRKPLWQRRLSSPSSPHTTNARTCTARRPACCLGCSSSSSSSSSAAAPVPNPPPPAPALPALPAPTSSSPAPPPPARRVERPGRICAQQPPAARALRQGRPTLEPARRAARSCFSCCSAGAPTTP